MTQNEILIKYLEKKGSITSYEAFKKLGITRLSGRIWEFKKEGYNFTTKNVTEKNRYGNSVTFAKYILEEVC